jgi:hypothetical protein
LTHAAPVNGTGKIRRAGVAHDSVQRTCLNVRLPGQAALGHLASQIEKASVQHSHLIPNGGHVTLVLDHIIGGLEPS